MPLSPPPSTNKTFNWIWIEWIYRLYEFVRDNVMKDYNLEVLRGNITGHSMVSIRGHDNTVPNGGPYGLSPGFGGGTYQFDQAAIDATPAVVSVASTDNTNDNAAGTGALTVRVSGLDSVGVAQSETVTMTGTTKANTVNTYSAVFSVLVLTTGTNNANTGTIWVGTGTFTAGVPAVRMLSMEISYNVSHSGYYVVPAANTLYLRQLITTVASSNKEVEVEVETSSDGSQWYVQGPFGVEAGDFVTPIIALPALVAGTHIRLRAQGSAASTIVTGILAAELVAN